MTFILRKKGYDQWACIKEKDNLLHISFGAIERASSFNTKKELIEAFEKGFDDMKKTATNKSEAINKKGGVRQNLSSLGFSERQRLKQKTPLDRDFLSNQPLSFNEMIERIITTQHHPGYEKTAYDLPLFSNKTSQCIKLSELINKKITCQETIKELFSQYGYIKTATTPSEYLPIWCQNIDDVSKFISTNLIVEAQAKSTNFLEAQLTYFVRSHAGWLGIKKGCFTFLPQMQQAHLFFDEQAAIDAIKASNTGYKKTDIKDCAIVKTQLLITNVFGADKSSSNWLKDPESAELSCGCESLSIEKAIQSAIDERQKAYELKNNSIPKEQPSFSQEKPKKLKTL